MKTNQRGAAVFYFCKGRPEPSMPRTARISSESLAAGCFNLLVENSLQCDNTRPAVELIRHVPLIKAGTPPEKYPELHWCALASDFAKLEDHCMPPQLLEKVGAKVPA